MCLASCTIKKGDMALAFGNFKFNEKQTVFQQWCICIKEKYQQTLQIASPPTRRISEGTMEGTTCQMECEPPFLSVSSGVGSSVLARLQWFWIRLGLSFALASPLLCKRRGSICSPFPLPHRKGSG